MTQRIFDIYNEKDYADLWDILPEEVVKIEKQNYGPSLKYYGNNNNVVSITYIIKINWHDKTEITRPVNYEKMIGCVGWFWNNDDDETSLGILTDYCPETGFPFVKNLHSDYYNFRPAKKSELKFWGE